MKIYKEEWRTHFKGKLYLKLSKAILWSLFVNINLLKYLIWNL